MEDFLLALLRILERALHLLPVEKIQRILEQLPHIAGERTGPEPGDDCIELLPDRTRPRGHRLEEGGARLLGCIHIVCGAAALPEPQRGGFADPGKEADQPEEGKRIAAARHNAQKAEHILDVRLFVETDAGRDPVADMRGRKLHLQIGDIEMRAVQHRDFMGRNPVGQERLNGRNDGFCLFASAPDPVQDGLRRGGVLARRTEGFRVLFRVAGDGGVRQFEDGCIRSVIPFELDHMRLRIPLRKIHDVAVVGTAPGVDALIIVADDAQVAMLFREQIDELRLKRIRILILIDKHVAEALLIKPERGGILEKEAQHIDEQIVEIHRAELVLRRIVAPHDVQQFLRRRPQVADLVRQIFRNGDAPVDRAGKQRQHNLALGEILDGMPGFADAAGHQQALIFGIENREIGRITDGGGVVPQNPVGDAVEGTAPKRGGTPASDDIGAREHFARRPVRKRQEQQFARLIAALQQMNDAIDERARLPGSGGGKDEQRTVRSRCGLELFGIEERGKVSHGKEAGTSRPGGEEPQTGAVRADGKARAARTERLCGAPRRSGAPSARGAASAGRSTGRRCRRAVRTRGA